MEWIPFWEAFENSVHNSALTDIQKMTYLKGYLKGEALDSIKGFSMIGNNYQEVFRQLQHDFGDTDSLIGAHIQKLDNLPALKNSNDVAGLKQLHRNVNSNVKSLEQLGHLSSTYGVLLGQRILHSIPGELQKKWADDKANKITEFNRVLEFVDTQISAMERYQNLKTPAKPPQQQQQNRRPSQNGNGNGENGDGGPTPICRCRVLYLGSAVPHVTKDGLQGIQEPLKELYPEDGALGAKGIDSWLSVWSNGFLLENMDENRKKVTRFFPVESLHYCAAVRYVLVPGTSSGDKVARFLPLDSPFARNPNINHPPLFAAILRRTTGIKVLECHVFICKRETAANALVR